MNFAPPPRTTQNFLPTPLFCPAHQGISEHSLMGGGGYTPENGGVKGGGEGKGP